jgi:hypothetical protein
MVNLLSREASTARTAADLEMRICDLIKLT